MKRTVLSLILAICVLFSAVSFAETAQVETAPAETAPVEAAPTEKTVPLIPETGEPGEITLRFYEATPNIPYLGINAYMTSVVKDPMTVEANDGILTLRNDRGGELLCDPAAGTIFTPDWVRVVTPAMPLENPAHSVKDINLQCVRVTDVTYEGEPASTTFDFAKYGMRIYADDQDVYLPYSVLSNMFTDIATNHLRYDGQSVYIRRADMAASELEDSILLNDQMKAWLAGEPRPADVISQCYAELCFNIDYFFGYPGRAKLDAEVSEKGLDQALTDLGEEGAAVKQGLLSANMVDYAVTLYDTFMAWLSDGHTLVTDISSIVASDIIGENFDVSTRMTLDTLSSLLKSEVSMSQVLHDLIYPQRALAWGDDVYREYGHTAIIRLDTFMPDEAAWASFYSGEGPFPEDCLGTVITGLRRARENGNITNVIFDLSCNGGGSSDVMMAMLAFITGQNQLYGRNRITGQSMVITYEVDANFDGVFDEKDLEERFDFNYGLLVTRHAFSCGNLFPIILREAGAVVIGEPSTGGSCCVQIGTDVQGIRYMMSSGQWQLIDSTGQSVEGGCAVDIPISTWSLSLVDKLISKLGLDEGLPAFNTYFDDKNLDTLMNAWFHVPAVLAPAA